MNRFALSLSLLVVLAVASTLHHCAPFLCQKDADCKAAFPKRPLCHYAKCKECIVDRDCPGKRCLDGVCAGSVGESAGEIGVDASERPPESAEMSPDASTESEPPDKRITTDKVPGDGSPSEPNPDAPPSDGGCTRQCNAGSDCARCGAFTACIDGTCGRPGSQCPPNNACTTDADCKTCGNTTVCVGTRCIVPICASSCSNDSNCASCAGKFKTCLKDYFCETDPTTCNRVCGDPTCNPLGCQSDDDCRGCTDGNVFCSESDSVTGTSEKCGSIRCPSACLQDSDCAHCPDGNKCKEGTCDGFDPCQTDEECKQRPHRDLPTHFCQKGICLHCRTDADCTNPNLPKCSPTKDRCTACLSDVDCKRPGFPRCLRGSQLNRCVACLSSTDCAPHGVCDSRTKVCKLKEGIKCDPKQSREQCAVGSCARLLPFHSQNSHCLKTCRVGLQKGCSAGLTCVRTGPSSTSGHCLRAGCKSDAECSSYPGFTCALVADGYGRVCAPKPPQAGSAKLGEVCSDTEPCLEGLYCVKSNTSAAKGICSKPCDSSNKCGKGPSGASLMCDSAHGDFAMCLFPCRSSNDCPTGLRCANRFCFP